MVVERVIASQNGLFETARINAELRRFGQAGGAHPHSTDGYRNPVGGPRPDPAPEAGLGEWTPAVPRSFGIFLSDRFLIARHVCPSRLALGIDMRYRAESKVSNIDPQPVISARQLSDPEFRALIDVHRAARIIEEKAKVPGVRGANNFGMFGRAAPIRIAATKRTSRSAPTVR